MANKRLKKKLNKLKLKRQECCIQDSCIQENKKRDFKIKDTKSVDIEKIRLVKEIHRSEELNSIAFEAKKLAFLDKLKTCKGKFPKDEAVLVWKEKDSTDKRKIVYNLEEGLENYLIAKDLELNLVQVNIIDSER